MRQRREIDQFGRRIVLSLQVVDEFADLLTNHRRSVQERVAAFDGLGPDLHPAVWKVIRDETDDLTVRAAAVRAVGRSPGAINQLTRRFHPPALRKVAIAELERLAQLGLPPYFEERLRADLQELERDPGGSPLINLGNTFGRDRRVIEAARQATKDSRPDVRSAAFTVLGQLGEFDEVLDSVSDSSSHVRAHAAHLIGLLSLARHEDIAALEGLAVDPDQEVRTEARVALRRLEALPMPVSKPRQAHSGDPEWVELLSKLAARVIGDREMAVELPDEALETGWLGARGASPAELADVEARLGVTLPPSYRAFLQTSNGWGRLSHAVERLLAAGEIVKFVEAEPEWVAAYERTEESSGLSTALQISTAYDGGVCLLIPSQAAEWETWFFANWLAGAWRHESFLAFMRSEMERP
ncbi:MAG TPA: HEAT repeat domain-containing protein [Candidatus Dormibacteraeota bacterium]|nr:HEAT repeat domain-containing protein [Candidatus Dormibacteraeota bacterium]